MKKALSLTLVACLVVTMAMLTACGPDKEKVNTIQTNYATLVNKLNNEIKPLYDELDGYLSQDMFDTYNSLADEVNRLGEKDTGSMSNSDIDAHIADLNGAMQHLDQLKGTLETIRGQAYDAGDYDDYDYDEDYDEDYD